VTKKVVGVFVRFRAPLHSLNCNSPITRGLFSSSYCKIAIYKSVLSLRFDKVNLGFLNSVVNVKFHIKTAVPVLYFLAGRPDFLDQ
jgi:hypothetical protein